MPTATTTEPAAFELRILDPHTLRVFRESGVPRLTIEGDRSWIKVTVARAFPLSNPDEIIGVLDGAGKDIGLIEQLSQVEHHSREFIAQELERRYFVPVIERVLSVKEEYGTVIWRVETDKGEIEFTVRNLRDNIAELSATRLMITDVDGNRFEIPDLGRLDVKAQGVIMRNL